MVNDGLASTNIDAVTFSGTTINANANNVGGQIVDMGTVTGSGNTSVVTYNKTFSATPAVVCVPTVGSVSAANQSVLSAIGTGSFSVATGSNIANSWMAIGSA